MRYVAVLVYGSPEIATIAPDLNEQLVHVPEVTESALPAAHGPGVRGSELPAPPSNGLVGDGDATLGEKILDIALRLNRWYSHTA